MTYAVAAPLSRRHAGQRSRAAAVVLGRVVATEAPLSTARARPTPAPRPPRSESRLVLAVSGHIQGVPTQLLFVDDNLADPAGDLSTLPTIYDTARQPIDAYLLCRERPGRP